jgi:hemolysin III
MNGITHGLGVLFAFVASILLSNRVKDLSTKHVVSCAVYSTSLLVLYTSSTLYHSFFALQGTRYIFEVLDKCAIYILIAGSYTPFLQVVGHSKLWSVYLLGFIWICCLCGVSVEAFFPTWKHKGLFSLAMYLGMGWSCVVCMPELVGILPPGVVNLLVLGGVGYTAGVPFFVRNNNLDHSIFHLFVLAGSMFHWFGIYWYLPEFP